jgi:single-stranded-DNA-specific exonuclease
MEKIWKLKEVDEQKVNQLHAELPIHKSLCSILSLRNITSLQEAQSFFIPSLDSLHDPFLMKGMQAAVDRVLHAFQNKQKIMLYGDYDVDGTTAVSVAYHFLKNYTDELLYYIPNRFTEGYGVSAKGIEYAKEQNVQLLITFGSAKCNSGAQS